MTPFELRHSRAWSRLCSGALGLGMLAWSVGCGPTTPAGSGAASSAGPSSSGTASSVSASAAKGSSSKGGGSSARSSPAAASQSTAAAATTATTAASSNTSSTGLHFGTSVTSSTGAETTASSQGGITGGTNAGATFSGTLGGSSLAASSTTTGSSSSSSSGRASTGKGSAGRSSRGSSAAGSSGTGTTGLADGGAPGYIDHLVVIVLENHTFDNLFSGFPGAESAGSHIPGPDGGITAPSCPDSLPRDLCHEHSCALNDWDHGAMDGWYTTAGSDDGGDHIAWCQYNKNTIPGFWDLAGSYGLADHFHASMLGPSFPGHTFLLASQAGRAIDNPSDFLTQIIWGCDSTPGTTVTVENAPGSASCGDTTPAPCFSIPSAPDVLPSNVTWKFYGTGVNVPLLGPIVWTMFDAISPIRNGPGWNNIEVYSPNYEDDIDAGALPNVTWLVDQDLNSGHPPLSMCASVTWATHYANDIINSGYWPHSAVLITWDDFGGFYDHVPPPAQYGCDTSNPYGEGFRLPLIIISPWVKHGVFHANVEQASVSRLIEELFAPDKVGALHNGTSSITGSPDARDDAAGSLLDAFDFNQTPLPATPGRESCP